MRKVLFYIFMFCISIFLMLAGAEILLRLSGVAEPWGSLVQNEPTMFVSDAVLGWRPKTGNFTLAPFAPQGHETHYTFLSDGSRATSDQRKAESSYDIIFIGGSFTEGFAVSDEETFAWKLQSRFPSLKIGNFGVGGYGTYQSLLLLRKLYRQGIKPGIVVYGFMPFHEERNVANSGWRKVLTEFSRRGHSQLPFCSLDENGNLVERKPIGYPVLPLHDHLALTDFAVKFYYRFIDMDERKRRKDGFEITKKLMVELNDLAERNSSSFYVAILGEPQQYEPFFEQSGIRTIDCRLVLDENFSVAGEGHPNERAHSEWADRITEFFQTLPVLQSVASQKR